VKLSASVNSGADLLRRIEGWGEADPLDGFTHETVDSILNTLQTLAPLLLGKNALDINQLNIVMQEISRDTPLAIGAIDIALWDMFGKYRRAPIYSLLGGTCGSSSFPLLWPFSSQTVMDDSLMIPDLMRQGFRTFMLKMGGERDDIQQQIDRVRSINETYPAEKIFFCADANQGWSLAQARQFVEGIRGLRIDFIEQPLNSTRDCDMALLKQLGGNLKFSADESAQTPGDVKRCLKTDDFDYISLKVSKNGGISRMKEIASACRVMGKKVLINSMLELGITQAAALHVAATCTNLLNCGHCFMSTLRTKDDVTNFKTFIREAVVHLPEGEGCYGLGIEIDQDKLEQYSVRETILFTK
jgi:muconate cycloisomerase